MPNLIDQYRKNMPRARFFSSQELQDMVRAKTPFYITQIFEGTGNFNGKEVKKWNLRCVPMMGGAEFLFSMGKTSYRDGLMTGVLRPEIEKNKKAGPVVLTFGIGKNSGRPMYDLEDFVPGAAPIPSVPVQQALPTSTAMPAAPASVGIQPNTREITAYCSICNTYPISNETFVWNGREYLPHKCSVNGKDELLVIEP